jgi:hypothetical protein
VAIEGPGFAGNVAVADEGAQVFGGSASRWPIVGTRLVWLGRIDSPQAICHAIDPERITINHADGLGKGWEGRKQEGSGQDGHFHPFWLARDYGENAAGRLLHPPGSTEVGKIVRRAAAERIVPASLELGGKSPSIVYPDADQDRAVDGIIAAMRFTRQSQSCTAGSRLFLHEDIFDSFLGKLEKKTTALRIGDPLDDKTDIGTIINSKQFTKVCKYVDEGLKRSDARLVFGGLPPKTGLLSEGYYALPTVFADRSNDWRLARARRSSGPSWWRSAWPTTAITASPPVSGRTISAPGSGCSHNHPPWSLAAATAVPMAWAKVEIAGTAARPPPETIPAAAANTAATIAIAWLV